MNHSKKLPWSSHRPPGTLRVLLVVHVTQFKKHCSKKISPFPAGLIVPQETTWAFISKIHIPCAAKRKQGLFEQFIGSEALEITVTIRNWKSQTRNRKIYDLGESFEFYAFQYHKFHRIGGERVLYNTHFPKKYVYSYGIGLDWIGLAHHITCCLPCCMVIYSCRRNSQKNKMHKSHGNLCSISWLKNTFHRSLHLIIISIYFQKEKSVMLSVYTHLKDY